MILEYCATFEDLLEKERLIIAANIGKPGCMNFNQNPVGFASGHLNHNSDPLRKEALRQRVLGDRNPAKQPGVGAKISASLKSLPPRIGRPHTDEAKKKISVANTGRVFSSEVCKLRSDLGKKRHQEGSKFHMSFLGRKHSIESIQKQKEAAQSREKKACFVCGALCTQANLTRWHNEKCNKGK